MPWLGTNCGTMGGGGSWGKKDKKLWSNWVGRITSKGPRSRLDSDSWIDNRATEGSGTVEKIIKNLSFYHYKCYLLLVRSHHRCFKIPMNSWFICVASPQSSPGGLFQTDRSKHARALAMILPRFLHCRTWPSDRARPVSGPDLPP